MTRLLVALFLFLAASATAFTPPAAAANPPAVAAAAAVNPRTQPTLVQLIEGRDIVQSVVEVIGSVADAADGLLEELQSATAAANRLLQGGEKDRWDI
ncbi:hypothetical protein PLICRDRAFT_702545 [Plicaturopsis crispa FD-325 SS-3]|uniref:Uncharacterized protein n=1 Tax=Plicaturopsis crispa FD-325 SS-3 TaxID=944288 RepID=A0A0C9SW09_PLICR|nr:hypothetical protein PLICRDRAFT_702545 [Plicaturopsis crispa FD-325 SS-3]